MSSCKALGCCLPFALLFLAAAHNASCSVKLCDWGQYLSAGRAPPPSEELQLIKSKINRKKAVGMKVGDLENKMESEKTQTNMIKFNKLEIISPPTGYVFAGGGFRRNSYLASKVKSVNSTRRELSTRIAINQPFFPGEAPKPLQVSALLSGDNPGYLLAIGENSWAAIDIKNYRFARGHHIRSGEPTLVMLPNKRFELYEGEIEGFSLEPFEKLQDPDDEELSTSEFTILGGQGLESKTCGVYRHKDTVGFIQTNAFLRIQKLFFFHYQNKLDPNPAEPQDIPWGYGAPEHPGYGSPAAYYPPNNFIMPLSKPRGVVRTEAGKVIARSDLAVLPGLLSVGPGGKPRIWAFTVKHQNYQLVELSPELEVLQRVDLYSEKHRGIAHAPTMPPISLEDGRVFVISNTAVQHIHNGAVQWVYPLPKVGPGEGKLDDRREFARFRPEYAVNSVGNALALIDGNHHLFVKSGHHLLCLDLKGELKWSLTHQGPHELTSNPLVTADGRLFIASRDEVLEVVAK